MNSSIVIALPKIDDAKKIRTILNRHGFSVAAVCSTASTALASMSELDGGILICGYKLTDRYYRDVLEDIPSYFEMLLLASGRVIAEAPTSVLTVEMPMKVSSVLDTEQCNRYPYPNREYATPSAPDVALRWWHKAPPSQAEGSAPLERQRDQARQKGHDPKCIE